MRCGSLPIDGGTGVRFFTEPDQGGQPASRVCLMEIHETPLPGVGTRYDFETTDGRQGGLVIHHTGRRELITFDRHDPDSCCDAMNLNEEEAETLASLLGVARFTGPLRQIQQKIEGLAIDWIQILPGSKFCDRPLGETQARTRTGASIVAVVRGESPFPSPRPDFVFEANDFVVAVGTPEGINSLNAILNG